MTADSAIRHRLLLSLRSERALGLSSVQGIVQPVDTSTLRAVPEVEQKPVQSVKTQPRVIEAAPSLLPVVAEAILMSDLPVLNTDQKRAALSTLNDSEVKGCVKCRLCETRTQTVFGEGDVDSKVFFVGEGPGENEDLAGRPFVGRSGQLLDKMIVAMGLSRERVFIANIVKCRPPDNRVPATDEVETCTPYLVLQIETVRPTVIVTLGLPAVKYMMGNGKLAMGKVRGQWQDWRGIKLMPTYHPAYVLRAYTEENRKAVWDDLQLVMKEIGTTVRRKT